MDPRLELGGSCATVEEAVREAARTQPELVIIDHFIDGDAMGLEVAPRIKQVAPEAAILLFSSHDLEIEASREPAVDRFLLKRDISLLMPTVREMLGLRPAA